MHLMESKNTDVRNVRGKAEKILPHMLTQKNVGKKYCERMKREAVYAVLKERLEYHVPQS